MRLPILLLSTIILIASCKTIFFTDNTDTKSINKKNEPIFTNNQVKIENPSSIEMYESIEKYSKIYKVPKYIAYNIAYMETRYKGPFDWNYKHSLESTNGAVGPMQILTSTANFIRDDQITKNELKYNIDSNIETSMKILSYLYNNYKDWGLVCGYYNTGKPIINEYANYCTSNKNYKDKWTK